MKELLLLPLQMSGALLGIFLVHLSVALALNITAVAMEFLTCAKL